MVPQVIFHQRTLSSSSYRSFREKFCRVLSMQVYKAGSFGRSLHGSEQLIHWSSQDHVGTIWVKLKCQSVQVTLIVRMIKFFQKYPQWPTKRNRSNFIQEAWREKGWARSKIIEKRSNVMGTYFEIIFPPGFLWFSLTSSSKTVTKLDESRPPRWSNFVCKLQFSLRRCHAFTFCQVMKLHPRDPTGFPQYVEDKFISCPRLLGRITKRWDWS